MGKNKKGAGRPSKKDNINFPQLLKMLASFGLTDKQISKAVGICEKTLNNYKKDKKIIQSLKKGKEISDKEVVKSLYKRALGYKYIETHKNKKGVIKIIEKEVSPDVLACIFWLKNRLPNDWRDKREVGLPDLKDKNVKLIIKGI